MTVECFGPVPSRRLGRSLGINNIPHKTCTYACVYCQLGRTSDMQPTRRPFYNPADVAMVVQQRVTALRRQGEAADYLAFVPDGEPTLDANLGKEIALIRPLRIPIAVITNSSLLWREDAREDLGQADWVSLKVDALDEQTWRRIDRPHGTLRLNAVLDGLLEFSRSFRGVLVTETMLVSGVNDDEARLREVGAYVARLNPSCAYLSIPTRPPAETWVQPPTDKALTLAYQAMAAAVPRVEYLIGFEGSAFVSTGRFEEDLLSITAVHPMRQEAVSELLARTGARWSQVEALVRRGLLRTTEYRGDRFYVRRLRPRRPATTPPQAV